MPINDKRLTKAERMKQALQLRRAGATVPGIADVLGVNKSTISRDLQQAYKELYHEDAKQLVDLEVSRFEEAHRAIWPKVKQGHLGAIDRFVKLSESRRRLLGLDAPTRVDLGAPDVDLEATAKLIWDAATRTPQ